jgi:heat shock protein HtpX
MRPMTAAAAAPETACPRCESALVTERSAAPWCPDCEWRLDTHEPHRRTGEFAWGWQRRLAFRLAYRMNRRQFTALASRATTRAGFNWPRLTLTLIAVAMLGMVVGLFALGIGIIVAVWPDFRMSAGVVLIAIGLFLVPRVGRLDPYSDVVRRDQAPALHALVDRVAATIGAPPPHIVQVHSGFNASSRACGLRRRRVLRLGLPMWAALAPAERVALIAHELGHFVNGDVRRGPLTSLAFGTFANLSALTRPDRRRPRIRGSFGATMGMGEVLATVVMGFLHQLFGWLQTGVTCVGLRSTQRAEYQADEAAARAAGTEATIGLVDSLVTADLLHAAVRRAARLDPSPETWRRAADQARAEIAPRLPRLRQLSLRDEASLLRTHPPSGLRVQMLRARPWHAARVELTAAGAARIDAELAVPYRTVCHDLRNA